MYVGYGRSRAGQKAFPPFPAESPFVGGASSRSTRGYGRGVSIQHSRWVKLAPASYVCDRNSRSSAGKGEESPHSEREGEGGRGSGETNLGNKSRLFQVKGGRDQEGKKRKSFQSLVRQACLPAGRRSKQEREKHAAGIPEF